jgi:hypothetical protein
LENYIMEKVATKKSTPKKSGTHKVTKKALKPVNRKPVPGSTGGTRQTPRMPLAPAWPGASDDE